MTSFGIDGDDFVLDGEPFRILSGAIHYFRVHPDDWTDRIRKAKLMGLNTIETYVPWNAHEPAPGAWMWEGGMDLDRFLRTIAEEGMFAIVRPGPYICAEWDNGGLPAWLFTDPDVGIRRSEPRFLDAVTTYLERVLEIVHSHQVDRGGPVILVQIENEYGAYGSDKDYLRHLVAVTRRAGVTTPLTTVDQPEPDMLENGSLPELLKTGSFGSRSRDRLATLREHQPTGPLMCSEFWDGWFDHWGAHHHTTSVEQSSADLDELLALGASVNIYMFHGGTNFGFTNGANDKGVYQPLVTSYDYDAPLDESGRPTEKFWAFRDVIAKYADVPDIEPYAIAAAHSFTVAFDAAVPLDAVADRLGTWSHTDGLPTFDALGHYSGFGLYRAEIDTTEPAVLEFDEVRDRAYVFVGSTRVGVLARDHHESAITLSPSRGSLTLLVEDQGRVDYGPRIGEPKGLIGPAFLNGEPLQRWSALGLELGDLEPIRTALDASAAPRRLAGPVFARAVFDLDANGTLFLDTSGWGKGVAWLNGFNLGRYWARGPQETLHVPRGAVRKGRNELIILELEAAANAVAAFVPEPRLGHTDF